jgi:ERCC4-type nuclease
LILLIVERTIVEYAPEKEQLSGQETNVPRKRKMTSVLVDVYEPDYLANLLSAFMQVQRVNLVTRGLCDIFWFAIDGHSITIERKSWLDLLNSLDRLQKQLRTATNHADEVGLIVEGVAVPLDGGEIALYEQGKNDKYLRQMKISGTKYNNIMAYLWELDKNGISVYHTSTIKGTAWALKAFVDNSQKTEHTLLKHYVRTRQIKWQSNPMVETIMAIKDEDGYIIGEKKAIEMAEQIGTLWDIIHLTPEAIAFACRGIGLSTAKRLIKAVKGEKHGST